jgi:hypothetical protein
MGYASIICVYDDAIHDADRSRKHWRDIKDKLGEATLQVCTGHVAPRDALYKDIDILADSVRRFPDSPDADARAKKLERLRRESERRVTSAPVGNHINAVEFCDKVHSSWSSLYLWSGNCLRRINSLDDEDFSEVEKLVLEEKRRRSSQ